MKISEFIEKLQDFKKEYGNLDVAIEKSPDNENLYFLDICLEKVTDCEAYSCYFGEVELQKGTEFLGIY